MTESQIVETAPAQNRAPAAQPPGPAAPSPRPRRRIFLIAFVLLILGFFIWRGFFANPAVPANLVALSGRIEGDDSAVSPKTSGRILEIRMREGDKVNAGDVIAVLDDEQIRARQAQAQAALTEAEAKATAAQAQIAVLQQQLVQSQMLTEQSKLDADGRVRQAEADLAGAEADLARDQAAYDIALFDKDAYTHLAQTGAVSERQGKQAVATADQAAAALAAGKRKVEASQGALTAAQANLSNPGIRGAQAIGVQKQMAQQQAEIASAAASIAQARAQLTEAEANRADLTVKAPFDGTVMTRAAEPGEVVTAGTAIVTLLDLSKVYLRGFVPEGEIGRVAVGQPARVYLDSNPSKPVDAYVSRIDPQATFTPENTYFREDRVKQVVGVKLQLKQAIGFAKPGMPADGEILAQGNTWPSSNYRK